MVLLQSGCLCCTMRGDLVDALETLLRDLDNRRCNFGRVLLETTGLADPAPCCTPRCRIPIFCCATASTAL